MSIYATNKGGDAPCPRQTPIRACDGEPESNPPVSPALCHPPGSASIYPRHDDVYDRTIRTFRCTRCGSVAPKLETI